MNKKKEEQLRLKRKARTEQIRERKTYKKKCQICGEPLRTRNTCRKHAKERRNKRIGGIN